MRCGNCEKTDGLCYTSNPPKVKCTITGKFHGYGDLCDVFHTVEGRCTDCLICGEPIVVPGDELGPKVCDKCKAAIMKVRRGIEYPFEEILD